MANKLGRTHKHFRFKMRATKELPSREFAVEFTPSHFDIRKLGSQNSTNRVRWERIVGAMLIWGNDAKAAAVTEGREFLIELSCVGHDTAFFEVMFGKAGVRIFRDGRTVTWSWRTILNFALSGRGY